MTTRIIPLHYYYGNAGKAPLTIAPSGPCRVIVSDVRPGQSEPGQIISSPTPFSGSGYVWIAAPMIDVTCSTLIAAPPPLVGYIVNPVGGLDDSGHDGSEAKPFATVGRAADAMASSPILTTYVRAGRIVEKKPWNLGNGMQILAHPSDPAWSAMIVNPVGHSGALSKTGIVLKGLLFDAGSGIEFDDCEFKVFKCKWLKTPYAANLQVYGPRAGSRVQGNWFAGATWNAAGPYGGVFPANMVWNDGKDYSDFLFTDNDVEGGTFGGQMQYQDNGAGMGIWTGYHFDRNNFHGWGSSLATAIGNEGLSMVGSNNPKNHDNTCSFNRFQQSADRGTVWAQMIEATTAGMTYEGNSGEADGGMCFGHNPGAVVFGSDFTVKWDAFSRDGGYNPELIEIGPNRINGQLANGPLDPLSRSSLTPPPSATGLARYAASPKYVG